MERSITHFEIYAEEPSQIPEFYGQIFRWRVERMPGVDYWRIFPSCQRKWSAAWRRHLPGNFRTQPVVALRQRCFNRRNGDAGAGTGRLDCPNDGVE
jgi:hypothetical protein